MHGKLIIVSGPSGTGKTTVVQYLIEHFPPITFSISATTRPPREHEIDGQDYYFLDQATFEEKVQNQEFLEYEQVYEDVYYGTLMSELERIWENNQVPALDIDVKGALNIKAQYGGNPLLIFIHPGSIDNLSKRLNSRGTENERKIKKRLDRAEKELELAKDFQHILYNYQLEETLARARSLVEDYM